MDHASAGVGIDGFVGGLDMDGPEVGVKAEGTDEVSSLPEPLPGGDPFVVMEGDGGADGMGVDAASVSWEDPFVVVFLDALEHGRGSFLVSAESGFLGGVDGDDKEGDIGVELTVFEELGGVLLEKEVSWLMFLESDASFEVPGVPSGDTEGHAEDEAGGTFGFE